MLVAPFALRTALALTIMHIAMTLLPLNSCFACSTFMSVSQSTFYVDWLLSSRAVSKLVDEYPAGPVAGSIDS